MKHAIGIDVGGTKIEGSLVSETGEVLCNKRIQSPATYDKMMDAIIELVSELGNETKVEGAGFSIPGSIDPQTNLLRNAPNSPCINGTDFFKVLSQNLDLPIQCENDANCLVMSEHRFGVAKEQEHVVGIILGTGVGAGVISNGKLMHGSRGLAPELGHTVLDVNGRLCLCGNQGCVEAYLSGPSILKRYHEAGGDEALQDTKELFKNTDAIKQKIIDETKYLFSRFIATIVSMYDPQMIVLGGGLSQQAMYYKCEEMISKYIFGSGKSPNLKPAIHGDASGKLGAAGLILFSRFYNSEN
jgi:fructokinase